MSAILRCPPEIFPLVASHLSVQILPGSLSALALTSKYLNAYVKPVLYSRVIVKTKEHAYQVLNKISTDADLGRLVRELHIRIDITGQTDDQTTGFVKLQEVIENGSLPHLKHLRLVLLKSEDTDVDGDDERRVIAQYQLPRSFWGGLRRGCPLIRGISVEGVGDCPNDPWVNEPEFYDMKDLLGMSALTFKYNYSYPSKECSEKLCRKMINLASSLQSLTVSFHNSLQDAGPLFSATLPYLKSISFHHIDLEVNGSTTDDAMDFWSRHPNLERVHVYTVLESRWFADGIEAGFLPKLTHLRAGFADVRALASHLGQLEHLNIADSYNLQIPYLLRSVLPDGLPNLKSLEIHQAPCSETLVRKTEGAMWYETESGEFKQERTPRKAFKFLDDRRYMPAIARGAPNLVELCLHGVPLFMETITQFCPILGRFKSLERLYCQTFAVHHEEIEPKDLEEFLVKCRLLGESCKLLTTVTDVGFYTLGPYLTGRIVRGLEGTVEAVVSGRGFGMELTGGDSPFPLCI